ncbi:MAG TPA: hypothetical protein VMO26_21025 [Vicinamibacterales bacterium]|nr:hypothetical protein [Vicinamibacterales bacterium]
MTDYPLSGGNPKSGCASNGIRVREKKSNGFVENATLGWQFGQGEKPRSLDLARKQPANSPLLLLSSNKWLLRVRNNPKPGLPRAGHSGRLTYTGGEMTRH